MNITRPDTNIAFDVFRCVLAYEELSVGPSVGPSVRYPFFPSAQKRVFSALADGYGHTHLTFWNE